MLILMIRVLVIMGLICAIGIVSATQIGRFILTRQLIYQADTGGGSSIYIHDLDRDNVLLLRRDAQPASIPVWSPDGARIAYVQQDTYNMMDIYVMDAHGRHSTRLTQGPRSSYLPTWSPDSQHIAFASNRDGDWDIYRMRADGSEVQPLTDAPGIDDQPAWSPDGQHILYRAQDAAGQDDLWLMRADGSDARRLTDHRARDAVPRWSPDGQYILWASERARNNPCQYPGQRRNCGLRVDLYRMRADGSHITRLTTYSQYYWAPAISPDRRYIAFTGTNRLFDRSIYIMDWDGEQIERLTDLGSNENFASWRP